MINLICYWPSTHHNERYNEIVDLKLDIKYFNKSTYL